MNRHDKGCRFSEAVETAIADQAEASAEARAQADALERELADDAGRLIGRFLANDTIGHMQPTAHGPDNVHPPTSLAEHARVRLRKSLPQHGLCAGTKGTVVHVYDGGVGLEVEFNANGKSPKVVTLNGDAVELVTD
jgi:hypothetical protein